jgi:site-specific DNA recombinase
MQLLKFHFRWNFFGRDRLIRLAFLAPEIVEAIIQGNHPPELTAQTLITGQIDLPLSWQAQKSALQF